MATLVENANRIKNAKESLRQSFINKGVNIASNTKLENYSPIVDELELLSESTVLKPLPNFRELKDYYYTKSNGTVTKETVTVDDTRRFTNLYMDGSFNSYSTSKSIEYYENYCPYFNGYYISVSEGDSYKNYLHTNKIIFAADSNGIQFPSSITTIATSANLITTSASTISKIYIVKLSDDVGLVYYYKKNFETYVNDIQYARLFKVAPDGTITFYTAVTTSTAASTTTIKAATFLSSLGAPNQIFVVRENYNDNTDVATYYYHQYSCNLSSGAITMLRAANSSGTSNAADQEFGNDNTYEFNIVRSLYGDPAEYFNTNQLAIFSRVNDSNAINMRVYFGDNRSQAWVNSNTTFDNNTFPLAFPVGKGIPCIFYKNGTWHPEIAGSSTSVRKSVVGYIKGKNKDGYWIGSYSITGTDIQNKEYLIEYDHTNNIFKPIKEL